MKLLLCKNIEKLGIVGDVVDVAPGYARNYLVPQGLGTEPTKSNIKALAEARKVAEEERIRERALLAKLAERMNDVEVTVHARANEDGILYGSVGKREISDALKEDGYPIEVDHIGLSTPLRQLDNVVVSLKFADGIGSEVKVWVVREKSADDEDSDDTTSAGTEAGTDDNSADA
jgi:large subunit ribosomal protein L9